MHNPLEQFSIKKLYHLQLAGVDISFTNSSLCMLLATIIIMFFLWYAMRNATVLPGRMQSAVEMIYEVVHNMIDSTTGKKGEKYIPLVFSIFIFILTLNLLGMVPYSFTVTSHIIVTFAMAIAIFIFVTTLGFALHGVKYLKIFCPSGTPLLMAPLMIVIEFFAYLARPISLSVRLAANMTAGHIALKVLASFVVMSGFFGIMPFILLTILSAFEIFVAVLQAYIFTILTCVYLSDALELH